VLLIGIGGGIAWGATDYPIGELARMGPGYFPLVLGVVLMGLGVLLLAVPALGNGEGRTEAAPEPIDLRGWGFIIGGLAAFLALSERGGMVPATFALVFLSALGDRRNTLRVAALLAVGATVVAVALFSFLLGVQLPLLAWGS
jgi:peptidoglycan/LPS O-acetylase OafA/YrhL